MGIHQKNLIPHPRIVYKHHLPCNPLLVSPLHISRDKEWKIGSQSHGQHTLNPLYSGLECGFWADCVASINSVVDVVLEYQLESEGDEIYIVRTHDWREESEKIELETEWGNRLK